MKDLELLCCCCCCWLLLLLCATVQLCYYVRLMQGSREAAAAKFEAFYSSLLLSCCCRNNAAFSPVDCTSVLHGSCPALLAAGTKSRSPRKYSRSFPYPGTILYVALKTSKTIHRDTLPRDSCCTPISDCRRHSQNATAAARVSDTLVKIYLSANN